MTAAGVPCTAPQFFAVDKDAQDIAQEQAAKTADQVRIEQASSASAGSFAFWRLLRAQAGSLALVCAHSPAR